MPAPPRLVAIGSRIGLVCASVTIIYLATLATGHQGSVAGLDKLNHFLAFYTLALLWDLSTPERRLGLLPVLTLLAYGIVIELVQAQLPHRSASAWDVAADAAGLLCYVLTARALNRHTRGR